MTELGALVMEMHRQRRGDAALVARKAGEALAVDREAAALARALGTGQSVTQVVAAGIAGGCPSCGALLATDDRFCARCGTPVTAALDGAAGGAAPPPDPSTRATAPAAAPPPDPATRSSARAAPPPDPTTRAAPENRGASAQMAAGTRRR